MPPPPFAAESGPARLSIRRESGGCPRSPELEWCLAGELDVDTAAGLREEVAVLVSRAPGGRLKLNLSGVTFCDTASLYTLLAIRQALPVTGTEVMLVEPSSAVRAAAERADVTDQLALCDGDF
ncbi:lipid asymmetry maintenance protein MlaB [Streptomyces sp. NPDC048182]|uniref:STAS domain-containing protein n=1 Tax=Streptomyces sp. NPDC048182 TaxID=3365507 RepID=UPI00371B55AD